MEVPRVRRTPVSTYQTLLAGWTSLGRSAPEGGKEDRKLRQRQEEQLAALRSSPSVRKRDRKFLPGSASGQNFTPGVQQLLAPVPTQSRFLRGQGAIPFFTDPAPAVFGFL